MAAPLDPAEGIVIGWLLLNVFVTTFVALVAASAGVVAIALASTTNATAIITANNTMFARRIALSITLSFPLGGPEIP